MNPCSAVSPRITSRHALATAVNTVVGCLFFVAFLAALAHDGVNRGATWRRRGDANTRRAMRVQFLLDAIAEKEQVRVAQAELIQYLVMSAQQYGMEPNEFAKTVGEGGQIPAMVAEVVRRKALAAVLNKAKVVDTAGNEVDLNELNAGGDAIGYDEGQDHDHEGHDHEGQDHDDHGGPRP